MDREVRTTPVSVEVSQRNHRQALVSSWNIQPGDRVLEFGCGQGDTTEVLAQTVGKHGSVVALDPASGDYGSPLTLAQAQDLLLQKPFGSRISFLQKDPLQYLAETSSAELSRFTSVVLAKCVWYFVSPSVLSDMFTALIKSGIGKIHLAEYTVDTRGEKTALPHLLAVYAHAAYEWQKDNPQGNIRTVLSPERVKQMGAAAGWKVEKETVIKSPDIADGRWEVEMAMGIEEETIVDVRNRSLVQSLKDAISIALVQCEVDGRGKPKVTCLDVWNGTFVPAAP